MGLKRTKLLDVQSITGISTVGIFTVGITDCTGPVGVASTTYLRSILMHSGVGAGASVNASVFLYPKSAQGDEKASNTGVGITANRILSVNLFSSDTYFFEPVYPIVLVDRESIVVEVKAPYEPASGTGIGSMVNFQILGDTDV